MSLRDLANASPEELNRLDWVVVHATLRQAQERLEKELGGRQTWLDGALGIAEARAKTQPGAAPAPVQVGIRLEGGVVQSVFTDRPVEVVVIDYDTDGCDPDDVFPMPQDDGRTSDCLVNEFMASIMPGEYRRIMDALDARDAKDAKATATDDVEAAETEAMRP